MMMPTAEERASADYARTVFDKILPADEAARRACLTALADSINRAHSFGASKWGVTLYPDVVRLNVGHVTPLDFNHHSVFVGVLRGAPAELGRPELSETDGLVDWQERSNASPGRGYFESVKNSAAFRVSYENFPEIWPAVQGAYAPFVERAAQGAAELHLDCQKAHSPGVLAYLRDALGRDIPEPSYPRLSHAARGGWREKLSEWLRYHSPTIPEDLRRLREEFVARFPKEKLGEMTLEEYAVGTGGSDNFSYWLEYKTRGLGGIGGGSAAKTGVWWSKSKNGWQWNERLYRSAEDAFSHVKEGLVELVRATEEGRFDELDEIGERHLGPVRYLRSKPLSLYFPAEFLPMWHPDHIANFLQIFGASPRGEVLARNRQLLHLLQGLPEFEDFDTLGMMSFLYDSYPQKKGADKGEGDGPPEQAPEPPPAPVPRLLSELMAITARTHNVLLYGPPGTGKTWLINHFANYFLLHHNVSPGDADAYWQARGTREGKTLSARVRGEAGDASEQASFWWMVASDAEEWRWTVLFERGEWFFGKRKLAQNFEEAKAGDFIFGYRARPHKKVVALARVEEGLETRVEDGEEKEGITIKPVKMLAQPLGWGEVKNNAVLKKSQPVKMNMMGTMFRLTSLEAQELARLLNEKGNQVQLPTGERTDFAELVTFHQSFAYEEFVEGLKPVIEGEKIGYKVEPGVFRRICASAEEEWRARGKGARKYLLVIDEINRANIAKVLGELITLVEDDKRLGEANEVTVRLPYSGERFGVPPNLYILGTMNTADRSIALLDLALRRRFTFVEMMPDPEAVEPAVVAGVDLRELLGRLNERVARLLDRDHQLGHSYLRGIKDAEHLHFVWYKRIVPLLQEYFYNDAERLRAAIGPKFVTAGGSGEEFERNRGDVKVLEGDEFLEALRGLAAGVGQSVGESP